MAQQQRRWVADRITAAINTFSGLKKAARPVVHALQDIRLASLLKANGQLRNRYRGERCLILGTGASLLEVDLPALADEYTFSCNEIFQHPDVHRLGLDFYTVVEPFYGRLYGRRYLEDIRALYTDIDRAFADSDPLFFFDATLKAYFDREGLLLGKRLHYVLPKEPLQQAAVLRGDLTGRITFAQGAVFTMIAASIYMGFRELYLFGCGYTYTPAQIFHFYDVPRFAPTASQQEVDAVIADVRERYPMYRVADVRDGAGGRYLSVVTDSPVELNGAHRIVRRYAEENGVSIINVVPEGFGSPVYDHISYDSFMRTVAKASR